jgi:hypothetical protein
MLSHEDGGGFGGQAAEDDVIGVDDIPFAGNGLRIHRNGFHFIPIN